MGIVADREGFELLFAFFIDFFIYFCYNFTMSKKEKITQDILDLRVYLVALIASFVALIGYVVNHYDKNDFLFYLAGITTFFVFFLIIYVQNRLNKKKDELGGL